MATPEAHEDRVSENPEGASESRSLGCGRRPTMRDDTPAGKEAGDWSETHSLETHKIDDGGREGPSPIWADWIDPDEPVRSVTIARVVQVGDGAPLRRSRGDVVLWPGEHPETRIWETAGERDDPQQTVIRATCHVSLGAVVPASDAVDHYRTLARSSASELGWPAGESGDSEIVTDGGDES